MDAGWELGRLTRLGGVRAISCGPGGRRSDPGPDSRVTEPCRGLGSTGWSEEEAQPCIQEAPRGAMVAARQVGESDGGRAWAKRWSWSTGSTGWTGVDPKRGSKEGAAVGTKHPCLLLGCSSGQPLPWDSRESDPRTCSSRGAWAPRPWAGGHA